jgi:multidrug resistance efflux pump
MSLALTDPRSILDTQDESAAPITAQGNSTLVEPKERATWKVVRIAVALPLFLASSATLFPYAAIPVSSQAVVNARLTLVRAPKEGNLQSVSLETGDLIEANQPLVKIRPTTSMAPAGTTEYERALLDLTQKRDDIESHLKANALKLSRANEETQSYTDHQISDLKTELQSARAQATAAQEKAAQLGKELARDTQAEHDHLMPHSMVAQASEAYERAVSKAEDSQNTAELLQRKIADLQNGYFGTTQSPVSVDKSSQTTDDSDLLRQQLMAVSDQIAEMKKTHTVSAGTTPGDTVVPSPVNGVVWVRAVAPGQSISAGDNLFRIADAASVHVEVWLDRRYGPQLSIGDPVMIYLPGLGKTMSGRVVSFQGASGRRMDGEGSAIDLQPVHQDQYHVTVELPTADRKATYIGQSAKVLFPGPKEAFKAKLYSWLIRL